MQPQKNYFIILGMKENLPDNVPLVKREELENVKEILLKECPKICMIILFGSYEGRFYDRKGFV